ncbi:hypothetical protein GF327_05860 [Candidatus Woesearchaeota archaeon]|nr:hypothetical protein [Candidatus Woesearchaeota archaeon]
MKKRDKILLSLVFFISVVFLFTAGTDIFLHVHNIEVYNKMISEKTFWLYDQTLANGKSFLYPYGVVAYLFGAVLWPLFNKYTIKIVELILFWILFYFTKNRFSKNKLEVWYLITFFIILYFDSYVYFVSFFLFHISFLFKGYKKDFIQLLAGFNHPQVSIVNLFFVSKKRKIFSLLSIFIFFFQFFLLRIIFHQTTGRGFDPLDFIYMIFRSVVLLYPIIPKHLLNFKVPNIKPAYYFLMIFTPFILVEAGKIGLETSWAIDNLSMCFHQDKYEDLPYLKGNIRVVDLCRTWVYLLPQKNMSSAESQWYTDHNLDYIWTLDEYKDYLDKNRIKYVVHCLNCSWPADRNMVSYTLINFNFERFMQDKSIRGLYDSTELRFSKNNELNLLERNYPIIFEKAGEYKIFKVI